MDSTDADLSAYTRGLGDGRAEGHRHERDRIADWLREISDDEEAVPLRELAERISDQEHWHSDEPAPF